MSKKKIAICNLNKNGKILECNENSVKDLTKDEDLTEVSELWRKYDEGKTNQICGGGGTNTSTTTSTTTTNEAGTQTPDDIFKEYNINDDDKKGILTLVKKLPDNISQENADINIEDKNIPEILKNMGAVERVDLFQKLKELVKKDQRILSPITTDAKAAPGGPAGKGGPDTKGGRRRRRGGTKRRRKKKSKRRKSKRRKKARKSKRRKSRKKRSKRRKSRRRR